MSINKERLNVESLCRAPIIDAGVQTVKSHIAPSIGTPIFSAKSIEIL